MGLFDPWDEQETTKSDVEIANRYSDYFRGVDEIHVNVAPIPGIEYIHECPPSPRVFEREGNRITYHTLSGSTARKYQHVADALNLDFSISEDHDAINSLLRSLAESHEDKPVFLAWGCKGLMEKLKRNFSKTGLLEGKEVKMGKSGNGDSFPTYSMDVGDCDVVFVPMFPQGDFAERLVKTYADYSDLKGVTFLSSSGGIGFEKGTVVFPSQVMMYSEGQLEPVFDSEKNTGTIITVDHILEEDEDFRAAVEKYAPISASPKFAVDCEMAFAVKGAVAGGLEPSKIKPAYHVADSITDLDVYFKNSENSSVKSFLLDSVSKKMLGFIKKQFPKSDEVGIYSDIF